MNIKINNLIKICLCASVLLSTIVFSAFNASLQIEGEATVRSNQDIRITNIKIIGQNNGAYETYNSKYNKDVTFMYITLPKNSSISYEVEITNSADVGYLINSIIQQSHTNSNVNVEITLKEYDIINANATKTFNITLNNNKDTVQNETLVYKYGFLKNKFIVTFDANGGEVSVPSKEVAYGSPYGSLPTPVWSGHEFKGWNGKNLVNIPDHNESFNNYYYYESRPSPTYTLLPDTIYTLSYNYNINSADQYLFGSVGYGAKFYRRDVTKGYSQPYYRPGSTVTSGTNKFTFTSNSTFSETPPNVFFRLTRADYPATVNVDISNVQLELGSIATPFEPFYISSTTNVVRVEDHTLKAIWD